LPSENRVQMKSVLQLPCSFGVVQATGAVLPPSMIGKP
jgi:hypothetical protein